jgi:hypothetical protein
MNDINEYLQSKFHKLPLSHQVFRPTAVNAGIKGNRSVGKKMDTKYKLQYIEFDWFYKPITTYL